MCLYAMQKKLGVTLATIILMITVPGCAGFEAMMPAPDPTKATPYQPVAFRGGYRETLTDDGAYRLEFLYNGFTAKSDAVAYWHRRAAELCGGPNRYLYSPPSGPVSHLLPLRVEGLVRCGQPAGTQKEKGDKSS